MDTYDYIVIGSGIAGLYTSLFAREYGTVLLLTKGQIDDCNTKYAQGGIAAAIGDDDSVSLHIKDTIKAGAGLCDKEAVQILAQNGPKEIAKLVSFGVNFDTVHGKISLGLEGAHSKNRILHSGGDSTGEHLETVLSNSVYQTKVLVKEHTLVKELIVNNNKIEGVSIYDRKTAETKQIRTKNVVLATGGGGQVYRHTTNSSVATGDGVSLAFLAGAEVMDMEFYQFHPTAFSMSNKPRFLISEAVRGAGAKLVNSKGQFFMEKYHQRADLAPRDIVARAIAEQMEENNSDCVYLDIRMLKPEISKNRFPSIYSFCSKQGIDFTKDLIPVAPAAHYMIGGVRTDLNGRTTIKNLYACGEIACSGLHGANRLASNSLLETIVYARRVVESSLIDFQFSGKQKVFKETLNMDSTEVLKKDIVEPSLLDIQQLMWNKVGIKRNSIGLSSAFKTLKTWYSKTITEEKNFDVQEKVNLLLLASLIAKSAEIRKESRGAHYRTDFSTTDSKWENHIVLSKE